MNERTNPDYYHGFQCHSQNRGTIIATPKNVIPHPHAGFRTTRLTAVAHALLSNVSPEYARLI